MTKKITFDTVREYGNEGGFECISTKDGYTLEMFITHTGNTNFHISIHDDSMDICLFIYTKMMQFLTTFSAHKSLSPTTDETIVPMNINITDDKIFLLSLQLGAYKSEKNDKRIPKDLIDKMYELLIMINNEQEFTVEGKKIYE